MVIIKPISLVEITGGKSNDNRKGKRKTWVKRKRIYAEGIKALMETTEQRLNTWSLPNYLKADLAKDLEALEVLLTVAE